MVDFIMSTAQEFAAQLKAQRRETVAVFEAEGWTVKKRKLVQRMDRLIARYED